MKVYKANKKNYLKLIEKGINPLFPVFAIANGVKYFLVKKGDNYFSYSTKKKWVI